MSTTIKVLKDTPFDKAGAELSASDFRLRYSYLVNPYNSDYFLVNYLTKGYKSDYHDVDLSQWFKVVQKRFKINDYVWHEKVKQAFLVTELAVTDMWPNHVGVNVVNANPEVYKRPATEEEVDFYGLTSICKGEVLIGRYKCYKKYSGWKEVLGIPDALERYLEIMNFDQGITVDQGDDAWSPYSVQVTGLKVGCTDVSNTDVLRAAQALNLIPRSWKF